MGRLLAEHQLMKHFYRLSKWATWEKMSSNTIPLTKTSPLREFLKMIFFASALVYKKQSQICGHWFHSALLGKGSICTMNRGVCWYSPPPTFIHNVFQEVPARSHNSVSEALVKASSNSGSREIFSSVKVWIGFCLGMNIFPVK